jgi:hypothetical protein
MWWPGLIVALREFDWTAVKITEHRRGVCPADGEASRAPSPLWQSVWLKPLTVRPVFRITSPNCVTPEMLEFVRSSLTARALTETDLKTDD